MNTLTSPLVSQLLQALYADAARTDVEIHRMFANLTPEERTARMADANADYRGFYAKAKDVHLAVSPETGTLLYMLARATNARSIVEFGTSFGLSTIHLAAAVKDNGGGRIIGSELEPSKIAHARKNLEAAQLGEYVEIRGGDALESFARDLPETIDLVLLDGAKPLYPRILDLLEPRLRVGAVLVADNVEASPAYVARVRSSGRYTSTPFSDEVELSVKTA